MIRSLPDLLNPAETAAASARATVYRTIRELENAGLIRKVARANDREVYEHDYGYPQHDHFICEKCSQLVEFRNEEISALLEKVSSQHGFRMTGHRLEVHGLCRRLCQTPRPPTSQTGYDLTPPKKSRLPAGNRDRLCLFNRD
ncbi:MAG UNVERIFIED_CONTAM: transcriptional repressor [Planctomycetaceae bacterium]